MFLVESAMNRLWSWFGVGLLLIAIGGCSGQLPANPQAAGSDSNNAEQLPFEQPGKQGILPTKALVPEDLTVPAGTPIAVRLQSSISSASANPGDSFEAVLDEPLVVNGQTVAPREAAVRGRVVAVRHSGRMHNSGYLRIALSSIEIEGKSVPVQSSSIFVMGGAHKKRNIALIGGGAGGGALIGALAGGGEGALIGGLVGAGAGTGAAYATGKKDVGFGAERRLTFRLTQSVVVKK